MSNDDFDGYSFAVTVAVGAGAWDVRSYTDPFQSPQDSLNAVRRLRSEGAAFALLCVDDDYFVVVRPVPGGARWFISDATMAVDDDFAAGVLEVAGFEITDIDVADFDDVDCYSDGDFIIFNDIGVNEYQLASYIDYEEYNHLEMLLLIAADLGFGDEHEEEINS